jgi:cytosine/uracil/thiamine/allantoin permease
VAGCAVAFVGLVYAPVRVLYDYAWFVGFGVSFVVYWALTAGREETAG